jgi:hypothetical protein
MRDIGWWLMRITRTETSLWLGFSPDSSCSVLWLVPEYDPGELAEAMGAVSEITGAAGTGFVGRWEGSKKFESIEASIARLSQTNGHFQIGQTRINADMLPVPAQEGWFWSQFGKNSPRHQICGVLVPLGADVPFAVTYAGVQLVLSGAARQFRPGSSHAFALRALEQAFLAETKAAGGVAVTRLRAELLTPGIALTSRPVVIDAISLALSAALPIEPILVERSRHLTGDW